MENKKDVKKRMGVAGYDIFHEYNDSPGEEFPDHDHPGDQMIVIFKESITVKMGGKDYFWTPATSFCSLRR